MKARLNGKISTRVRKMFVFLNQARMESRAHAALRQQPINPLFPRSFETGLHLVLHRVHDHRPANRFRDMEVAVKRPSF